MNMFRHGGPRTERLLAYLRRRARLSDARRAAADARVKPRLMRTRAVVFTDTRDFTVRTARDGILHCLMLFDQAFGSVERAIEGCGGEVVKMEGDSLLLRFDDMASAYRGILVVERALARLNRRRRKRDQLRFAYGIGCGEVLDLEHDVFGLEVNLASKIGEDLAEPGEVLLTQAAAAALDRKLLRRVVPHRMITFENSAVPVHKLKLPRS